MKTVGSKWDGSNWEKCGKSHLCLKYEGEMARQSGYEGTFQRKALVCAKPK